MVLAEECYRVTASFPAREEFILTAQMRRAAISVASNIAEGHSQSTARYRHHLTIAVGSVAELATQLELACRVGYVPRPTAAHMVGSIEHLTCVLHALLRSLRRTADG